jgi:hypothetical protein
MSFLKKTPVAKVYQKRTLIVTQPDIFQIGNNNRTVNINNLQNRHAIQDCLFRFDFACCLKIIRRLKPEQVLKNQNLKKVIN